MASLKQRVIAHETSYIDPVDWVGYRIHRGRWGITAEVDLADCTREIEWYFDNKPGSIEKIDRAIAILTRFREQFQKARTGKQ